MDRIYKRYKTTFLPNGGRLVYCKNKTNKATYINLKFKCGAVKDTIPGLAHFTEHMLFSGTDKLTKEDVSKKFFSVLECNAATSMYSIDFRGKILTGELATFLSNVFMLIDESTFTSSAIEKEKKVVFQEINRGLDNYSYLANSFNSYNLFQHNIYKYNILGTKKTIGSITSDDVKQFVKKYFVANNIECKVLSPLPLKKVKKIIIDSIESKLSVNNDLEDMYLLDCLPVKNSHFYEIKTTNIDKSYIYINFLLNKNIFDFEYGFKLAFIQFMLNNYALGILKDMRLKKSLVYSGGFYPMFGKEFGILYFYTTCEKENIDEVLKTTAEYIKNILKTGFSQEQFDEAKKKVRYDEELFHITNNYHNDNLEDLLVYHQIVDDRKYIKQVQDMTIEECNEIFRDIFKDTKVSASIYTNANKDDIMSKKEFYNLFKF